MKLNWGHSLVVFFIIFFALIATFIIFSFNQNIDLVSDDYYEQGANYNSTIEQSARSAIYTDSIIVRQETEFVFIDFPETLWKTDSMLIHFYCGSDRAHDKFIKTKDDKSSMIFDKKDLEKTHYMVQITWYIDSLSYKIEKSLLIK